MKWVNKIVRNCNTTANYSKRIIHLARTQIFKKTDRWYEILVFWKLLNK